MKKIICFLICLSLIYSFIQPPRADVGRITTIQRFQGLSTDTKSIVGVLKGSTFYESNTGLTYIYNGSAWVITGTYAVGDTTSFTAPGTSAATYCRGFDVGGYLFTISSIGTVVTMVLEGKAGNSEWTAIGEDSTRYTNNDSEGLISANIALYDSMRIVFLSEAGGTNAFINYNSTLGRMVR